MASQRDDKKKKKTNNPPKKPKKDPVVLGDDGNKDDDDDEDDLEQLMEGEKRKQKTPSVSKYVRVATTGEYTTTGEDRKSRMIVRQGRVDKQLAEAKMNVPEETEEEAAQGH